MSFGANKETVRVLDILEEMGDELDIAPDDPRWTAAYDAICTLRKSSGS